MLRVDAARFVACVASWRRGVLSRVAASLREFHGVKARYLTGSMLHVIGKLGNNYALLRITMLFPIFSFLRARTPKKMNFHSRSPPLILEGKTDIRAVQRAVTAWWRGWERSRFEEVMQWEMRHRLRVVRCLRSQLGLLGVQGEGWWSAAQDLSHTSVCPEQRSGLCNPLSNSRSRTPASSLPAQASRGEKAVLRTEKLYQMIRIRHRVRTLPWRRALRVWWTRVRVSRSAGRYGLTTY